jgi:hypothetical protein
MMLLRKSKSAVNGMFHAMGLVSSALTGKDMRELQTSLGVRNGEALKSWTVRCSLAKQEPDKAEEPLMNFQWTGDGWEESGDSELYL